MHRSSPLALLSLMLLSVVPACGDPATPEAKLEAAGNALDDAREDTNAARESLADAKERLAAAETELRDGRKAMRAAEKRVLSARARVYRRARSTPGVSTVRDHLDVESDEAS